MLFAGVGLLQHEYVHTSFLRSVDRELAGWASEVATEVAYKERWDLADYRRRASVFAPRWWIIARDGLVVDIAGLEPNVFKQVKLVGESKFGSPTTVDSSIGESWRILGKKIDGGLAVVGIASPTDLTQTDADAKLAAALDRFGTSVAEAAHVRDREIDSEVDSAVIATSGALVHASGGVPLMTNLGDLPLIVDTESATTLKDGERSYRLLSPPIRGTSGRPVGAIVVPKDITGELQALADQDRFNIVLVLGSLAFSALAALGFAARELWRRRDIPTVDECSGRSVQTRSAGRCRSSCGLSSSGTCHVPHTLRRAERDVVNLGPACYARRVTKCRLGVPFERVCYDAVSTARRIGCGSSIGMNMFSGNR